MINEQRRKKVQRVSYALLLPSVVATLMWVAVFELRVGGVFFIVAYLGLHVMCAIYLTRLYQQSEKPARSTIETFFRAVILFGVFSVLIAIISLVVSVGICACIDPLGGAYPSR